MKRTRILVVDDSVTIRAMIETILERESQMAVVGVARNADEAFALIRDTDPDVITLDIAMPGMDGMTMLDEIMHSEKPRNVIMLSSLLREGTAAEADALEHGAAACFNKAQIVREAGRLVKLIGEVAKRKINPLVQAPEPFCDAVPIAA
jgi:two-component system chemotaxis response regulator CheB